MSIAQAIQQIHRDLQDERIPRMVAEWSPDDADWDTEIRDDVQKFQGRRWQEIGDDILDAFPDSVLSLPPDSFVYYLPCFLEFAINNPDDPLVDKLLLRLMPPIKPAKVRAYAQDFAGMCRHRTAFLKRTLELIAEGDAVYGEQNAKDARRCLERYWSSVHSEQDEAF